MSDKYKNLKVKELQELLQKYELPHTGKKEELIDRLVKHDEAQELETLEKEFGDLEEFDESTLDLTDIKPLEEEIKEDELETVAKENTAETETKAVPETVVEPGTKPNSNFKFTPVSFDKPTESPKVPAPAASPVATASPTATTATTPKADDAEKALERAKRFGIQLNDKAKKDIRAQRFGIAATPATTATSPKKVGISPEVLKKRTERFGTSKPASPVNGKVPVSLDPAEEEKKRKRAERFTDSSKKQKAD